MELVWDVSLYLPPTAVGSSGHSEEPANVASLERKRGTALHSHFSHIPMGNPRVPKDVGLRTGVWRQHWWSFCVWAPEMFGRTPEPSRQGWLGSYFFPTFQVYQRRLGASETLYRVRSEIGVCDVVLRWRERVRQLARVP